MKVICIDNTAPSALKCVGRFMVKEGQTYTVSEIVNWYGMDWYLLKEDDGGNGWNPKFFIPIDENKFDTVLKKVLTVPKIKILK